MDCSRPGSVAMETLTAKESVVLELDEEAVEHLTLEHRKWVEQVNDFLERYMYISVPVHVYTHVLASSTGHSQFFNCVREKWESLRANIM